MLLNRDDDVSRPPLDKIMLTHLEHRLGDRWVSFFFHPPPHERLCTPGHQFLAHYPRHAQHLFHRLGGDSWLQEGREGAFVEPKPGEGVYA